VLFVSAELTILPTAPNSDPSLEVDDPTSIIVIDPEEDVRSMFENGGWPVVVESRTPVVYILIAKVSRLMPSRENSRLNPTTIASSILSAVDVLPKGATN
jgi:hypothetical protein